MAEGRAQVPRVGEVLVVCDMHLALLALLYGAGVTCQPLHLVQAAAFRWDPVRGVTVAT